MHLDRRMSLDAVHYYCRIVSNNSTWNTVMKLPDTVC